MTFAHLCSVEGENRIDETLKLLIEFAKPVSYTHLTLPTKA